MLLLIFPRANYSKLVTETVQSYSSNTHMQTVGSQSGVQNTYELWVCWGLHQPPFEISQNTLKRKINTCKQNNFDLGMKVICSNKNHVFVPKPKLLSVRQVGFVTTISINVFPVEKHVACNKEFLLY